MTRAWGTVRLVHPFPSGLVTLASVAFILVIHGGNPGWGSLFRAAGVVAGSQVAVGALNDFLDRESDARGQPDKPIPAGLVSPSVALGISATGLVCFIALAATFGPAPFAVACLGTLAGLAYDLWLKPTAFSLVGYLIGFLSLITWIRLIAGDLSARFLLVYPASALIVVVAHLAQSFPDIESDAEAGSRGLAVRLGAIWTFRIIAFCSLLVASGGLALSIFSREPAALGCTLIAALVIGGSLTLNGAAAHDLDARERLFYPGSLGMVLAGIGCLLAIAGLN